MTMTFLFFCPIFTLIKSGVNPVKMSLILMITSIISLTVLALGEGFTWMSTIFILLFTGGILIMFMILSSILPNEKTKKSNMNTLKMLVLLLVTSTFLQNICKFNQDLSAEMKSFLSNSWTMIFMTFLMSLYFYIFTNMISFPEMSLRK